ncbi:MAG: 4Fe-4S binding protein [Theionarchaea archaeon]|nr:4Fe-4S binding protein [Theionarchaea archaeon]MBU7000720.1 4Fe-4S binding protein [Theionarchaea archaeon]MBU7033564.1 4Fe-4S binding protein [Theionarchaea archaeon]MBU7039628.1 4Fe-4S binding protein [Theionarchaea archaeon]
MSRSVGLVGILKKGFPLRFFIARLTRVPLLGRIMDTMFFKDDGIIYLPIDRAITVNEAVASESMVLPSSVVEHFIEKAAYHWVMNFCICRDAAACKDYPVELGCLFMGEAAMKINPELGRRVTKEEALEHVRKCREAGLIHLIGRNKLDTVWLNVGPGNRLLTVCNCCPCCCLWRMLPDLAPEIGMKVTKMPGITMTVTDACVGCRTCESVCFVNAVAVTDGRAQIHEECRGCGRCVDVCPQHAIMVSVEGDPVERSIDFISDLVDIT